jgi:hypothetical protein
VYADLPEEQLGGRSVLSPLSGVFEIHLHRGRLDQADALLALYRALEDTAELQIRPILAGARAALARAQGRDADALAAGGEAAGLGAQLGYGQQGVKTGFVWAVDAALARGDSVRADELLGTVEVLPPGLRPPFLEAHTQRFRARIEGNEAGFKAAAGGFREFGFLFWLAVTQLEHGEWLIANGRAAEAEPLLAEAREIFTRLQATPWVERVELVSVEAEPQLA